MKRTRKLPVRKNLPLHLKERLDRWYMLVKFGNVLSGLYSIPMYLVGSALREDNDDPRDWDIRCRFPNKLFEAKFGNINDFVIESSTGLWTRVSDRWSIECVKRSKQAWKETHLNIDFQIQVAELWTVHRDKPKIRIDTRDLIK